jgi:hypothetical protein
MRGVRGHEGLDRQTERPQFAIYALRKLLENGDEVGNETRETKTCGKKEGEPSCPQVSITVVKEESDLYLES